MDDLISRKAAIDEVKRLHDVTWANWKETRISTNTMIDALKNLPAAQPEKETPKRVLWTGWKGYRYTRYKCPNCKKPVKNDDVYCHRCGQKLMFPHVDWTPYVEGQKQELIVRWDDE